MSPQDLFNSPDTPLDRKSIDDLFSVTYEELRRLAANMRRSDPRATVSATTLVNEAWIKLARSAGLETASLLHFKRIAARAMRQLLIEAARRRKAEKRGGDSGILITLHDGLNAAGNAPDDELLALDEALDALAQLQPRQAALVESRFFGGMEVAEAAQLLGISEATALRDWRAAKAWLAVTIRPHSKS